MQDVRSIVNARFGKADRVKVGKVNYAHDLSYRDWETDRKSVV